MQGLPHNIRRISKLSKQTTTSTRNINTLNNIGQFSNEVLLVTLDVTSLYTNIPHKDGIQACSDLLDRRTNPTIKTTRLCDLIRLILTNNTFTFNGQHYRQINGTAMGPKMAPSYANLFMGKFEQEALATVPWVPEVFSPARRTKILRFASAAEAARKSLAQSGFIHRSR